jgi:hypothetical protein
MSPNQGPPNEGPDSEAAPVKVKKLKAPVLQAAIDNAGGELQRAAGAGGASHVGHRCDAERRRSSCQAAAQGVLPVKGDIIEALWTGDGKVKGWFAVEVLLGDVSQRQAKEEKRQRYMKCHLIQYTGKSLEWDLLSWPDRPTSVRRAGESKSTKYKAKQEAALEVVHSVALPGPVKSFPWAL